MKNDHIDFKSVRLFPFHILLLGIVFLLLAVVTIIFSPIAAPFLLILGLLIVTGHQGIEFNTCSKTYREYNSFLLLKFGHSQPYNSVEKIFINSSNTSQKIYTMVTTGTTSRNVEYNAYLKFGDESKIYLYTHSNKAKLKQKLQDLSGFFDLQIIDNT